MAKGRVASAYGCLKIKEMVYVTEPIKPSLFELPGTLDSRSALRRSLLAKEINSLGRQSVQLLSRGDSNALPVRL